MSISRSPSPSSPSDNDWDDSDDTLISGRIHHRALRNLIRGENRRHGPIHVQISFISPSGSDNENEDNIYTARHPRRVESGLGQDGDVDQPQSSSSSTSHEGSRANIHVSHGNSRRSRQHRTDGNDESQQRNREIPSRSPSPSSPIDRHQRPEPSIDDPSRRREQAINSPDLGSGSDQGPSQPRPSTNDPVSPPSGSPSPTFSPEREAILDLYDETIPLLTPAEARVLFGPDYSYEHRNRMLLDLKRNGREGWRYLGRF